MNRIIKHSSPTALLCLIAGTAIAQPTVIYEQGTISRQRNRLDHSTIAPSTNGWLNDSTTPKFWAWDLYDPADYPCTSSTNCPLYDSQQNVIPRTTDTYKHPQMQRWIQHHLWGSSLENGTISTNNLGQQAVIIANKIAARYNAPGNDAIADGEYAICILGMQSIDLHDHQLDDLNIDVDLWNDNPQPLPNCTTCPTPLPLCEPWGNFENIENLPSLASPWRSNGVQIADSAIEYLTDQIVTELASQGITFPKPLRIFFDEERGRTHSVESVHNLGEIASLTGDLARRTNESLYGNYDLWTSNTPVNAAGLFQIAPLANIFGWNSPCTPYTPNVHTNATGGSGTQSDHEFFPIYNMYNNLLGTAIDGALEAAMDHPLSDPNWTGFKWSNYFTSVYTTFDYPRVSGADRGVLNPGWTIHEGFGFVQTSMLGSGSIQSPVLYPPSEFHERELYADGLIPFPAPEDLPLTQTQREADTWLRYSRMQLDHIIFSFEELTSPAFESPRHIAPWITRVGTLVHRPGLGGGNDFNITTKSNVRDIVALCKAKGVNEILFWGNPRGEGFGSDCNTSSELGDRMQHNWDSTNDLLSQVYDYSLNRVWFNTESRYLASSEYESMRFSEEHALDMNPTVTSAGATVQFSAEFDIGTISSIGDQYTFVCEVLDGGGPWADATYTLEIYNYKSLSYEAVNTLPTELMSNSTRRAVFNDSDTNGYSDSWSRPFDDESTDITTVYDRKLINAWKDIPLPNNSSFGANHYAQNGKMKLRITATHSSPTPQGEDADPFRIDLVQLYETECENNNIEASSQLLLGDINNDMVIDADDIILYMQEYVSNPSLKLDLNNDGQIDLSDVNVLNKLVNKK